MGATGDIGRTVFQQLLAAGTVPAGIVINAYRLESAALRNKTAAEISRNFGPEGERVVLDNIKLTKKALKVGSAEIPVFTPDSQHEIFQEGHPVIDATGKHKTRALIEPMLEAGAKFVLVTSPVSAEEGIQTIVYGVNDDDTEFTKALQDGMLSTSSCTTTAVTSFLMPILSKKDETDLSGILVDVKHARTKSNSPMEIANNIEVTSSGGIKEIPKILNIKPDQLVFNLQCIRANVACGSLASITLLFGPKLRTDNLGSLKAGIVNALKDSGSIYRIDSDIKDVKNVVGKKESAVINLDRMTFHKMPGGESVATNIDVYYDNVTGYTRSALDSYKAMVAAIT